MTPIQQMTPKTFHRIAEFDVDRWPGHTTVTQSDVLIAGVELSQHGQSRIRVGARLDACRPNLEQCRLIGRASDSTRFEMTLVGDDHSMTYRTGLLPADLRAGDLIAFPCSGVSVLHDVRPVRRP